jgi:ribosomal protein L29
MKELKNKTEKDLAQELFEKRQALRTFRFDISGSKVKNVKQGKGLRKEIAQIMTELNSRSVQEVAAGTDTSTT